MIFKETSLSGAFVIDIEKNVDERGFFARTWCRNEFSEHNLNTDLAQFSISFNKKKGTLRGLHFQINPYEEIKIVRCTSGSIYDVIVDLRKDSATYLQSFGIELTAQNRTMLYIPEKFAHGFITLEDNTEVFYMISEFYAPESSKGIRWDDPRLAINWPVTPKVMSAKDRNLPLFDEKVLL